MMLRIAWKMPFPDMKTGTTAVVKNAITCAESFDGEEPSTSTDVAS